jgi:hypothetical protein
MLSKGTRRATPGRRPLRPQTSGCSGTPTTHPAGEKVARCAIQLGLRGDVLHAFATTEILDVIDMTAFVVEQRAFSTRDRWLQTPEERVYRPLDPAAAENAGLDAV